MAKHRNSHLGILVTIATVFIAVMVFLGSNSIEKGVPEFVDKASAVIPETQITETPFEIVAPDEKNTLKITDKKNNGNLVSQIISVTNIKTGTEKIIFTNSAHSDEPISIPYNVFSPDDKYIFLKIEGKDKPKYIALRTDGINLKNNQLTVEITSIFETKYPDLVITDITGWGGMALLVVNTDFKDGSRGPSLWFDMSNLSSIRLNTRFN